MNLPPLDHYAQSLRITTHELLTPEKLQDAREHRTKLVDAIHGLTDEQRNAEFHVGWLRDQADWFVRDGNRSIDITYRPRVLGTAQAYRQVADDLERSNKIRSKQLASLSEVLDL